MAIATINPATGETVKSFDEMSEEAVEQCLAAADRTHAEYRLTTFAQRAGWMREAARILDAETEQIAAMMTTEMGKTLASAQPGDRQVRGRLPVLRRACGSVPGRRAG